MTMEEAFRREKEEADRLLREQKLEYESKIVELQKQVMETSMSQSMLSSILSSTGLVDTSSFMQQFQSDYYDDDESDALNGKFHFSSIKTIESNRFPFVECSWSERDYQLAWWAWKKWRYHQTTSLRVRITLYDLHINIPIIVRFLIGLLQSYSTYLVNQGTFSICSISLSFIWHSDFSLL